MVVELLFDNVTDVVFENIAVIKDLVITGVNLVLINYPDFLNRSPARWAVRNSAAPTPWGNGGISTGRSGAERSVIALPNKLIIQSCADFLTSVVPQCSIGRRVGGRYGQLSASATPNF